MKKPNSRNDLQLLSMQAALKRRRNAVHGCEKKRKIIDEKVVKYIVQSCSPFQIVEYKDFKDMIEFLDDRYTLPSRKKVTKMLLSQLYQKMNARLGGILMRVKFIQSIKKYKFFHQRLCTCFCNSYFLWWHKHESYSCCCFTNQTNGLRCTLCPVCC